MCSGLVLFYLFVLDTAHLSANKSVDLSLAGNQCQNHTDAMMDFSSPSTFNRGSFNDVYESNKDVKNFVEFPLQQ